MIGIDLNKNGDLVVGMQLAPRDATCVVSTIDTCLRTLDKLQNAGSRVEKIALVRRLAEIQRDVTGRQSAMAYKRDSISVVAWTLRDWDALRTAAYHAIDHLASVKHFLPDGVDRMDMDYGLPASDIVLGAIDFAEAAIRKGTAS